MFNTTRLSIPDTHENIEFDENLQQILEEICKFLDFSTVRLRSNNNNNVLLSFYSVDESLLAISVDDAVINCELYSHRFS